MTDHSNDNSGLPPTLNGFLEHAFGQHYLVPNLPKHIVWQDTLHLEPLQNTANLHRYLQNNTPTKGKRFTLETQDSAEPSNTEDRVSISMAFADAFSCYQLLEQIDELQELTPQDYRGKLLNALKQANTTASIGIPIAESCDQEELAQQLKLEHYMPEQIEIKDDKLWVNSSQLDGLLSTWRSFGDKHTETPATDIVRLVPQAKETELDLPEPATAPAANQKAVIKHQPSSRIGGNKRTNNVIYLEERQTNSKNEPQR